jgi:hypothetical protein
MRVASTRLLGRSVGSTAIITTAAWKSIIHAAAPVMGIRELLRERKPNSLR